MIEKLHPFTVQIKWSYCDDERIKANKHNKLKEIKKNHRYLQ